MTLPTTTNAVSAGAGPVTGQFSGLANLPQLGYADEPPWGYFCSHGLLGKGGA